MPPIRPSPDDYIVLHHRDRLAADGAPAMAERFLSRLDRCLAATREDAAAAQPLTLIEGLARLHQEYPALATAVDQCCVQGQTLRAAAVDLGIDHCTVHKRRRQAVAQLVVWCDLREQVIEDALGEADKRLA